MATSRKPARHLNPLKAKIKAGQPTVGLLVTIPSVPFVQTVARTGFDWVMIDMEHGPIGLDALQGMLAATQGTECVPLVRPPKIDPTPVKGILDAGAFGLIYPMCKTADDARLAMAAMRYPPEGVRGIAPIAASTRWGIDMATYLGVANDELVGTLLIEDIAAVENIEEILRVPGIDVAQIAPFDLSASLGLPGQLDHPKVKRAVAKAEAAILASGIMLGGLGQNVKQANAMIARGYRSIVMTHDKAMIEAGAALFTDGINRKPGPPPRKAGRGTRATTKTSARGRSAARTSTRRGGRR